MKNAIKLIEFQSHGCVIFTKLLLQLSKNKHSLKINRMNIFFIFVLFMCAKGIYSINILYILYVCVLWMNR